MKYILPVLTGLVAGAISAALSLALFVYGSYFLPGIISNYFDADSLSLTVMMVLAAFLLYASMLLCRKCNGRFLHDPQEEKRSGYLALFLIGAALAAACAMILALSTDWSGDGFLVMICYMILCNLIVIIAFSFVMLLLRWVLQWTGKGDGFLYRLKWQLLLSLLWFAIVYTGFIFF